MFPKYFSAFFVVMLLAATVDALSIEDIKIYPSNQLYLDDSFSVIVKLAGNSCKMKVRFTVDGRPFNSSTLFNGTKYLSCGVSEVNSGVWDLKKSPLSGGTHVLKIELIEPVDVVVEDDSQLLRIFEVKRPQKTTTSTSTTTSTKLTSTKVTTSTTTSTTVIKNYVDYVDEVYGFRFSYPDTWVMKKNPASALVVFEAPYEEGRIIPDIFQENFSVSVVRVDSAMSLDSFVASVIEAYNAAPFYKVTGSSNVVVSGEVGRQLNLEYRIPPLNMRAQRVYIKRNDLIYVLAYNAEDTEYVKYLSDFNRMKDSFLITIVTTTTTTSTTLKATTSTTLAQSKVESKIDWSFVALAVSLVFIFFVVFNFVRKSKKRKIMREPQKLPPWEPRSPPIQISEEDSRDKIKDEVTRKTASIVSNEVQIEEPQDPAYERLKRIKALEKEVDELIKRERAMKKPKEDDKEFRQ